MKYGWINGNTNTNPDNNLRWMVGGVSKWNVDWVADVWHNFAYEIDFSGSTVTLWHSVGSDPLVKTAGPFSASTSTNSADWHLGVLRLPASGSGVTSTAAEDWYYSGVYVESGSINTVIGSGTSSGSTTAVASTSVKSTTTAVPTTTTAPVTTTVSTSAAASATGALAAKWAQCGGVGWTGATACVSGATCTKLNDYYSQVSSVLSSYSYHKWLTSGSSAFKFYCLSKRWGCEKWCFCRCSPKYNRRSLCQAVRVIHCELKHLALCQAV